MKEHEAAIGCGMSRRQFLELSGAGLASAALLGATEYGSSALAAPVAAGSKTLTLGNIGWDECVATSNLTAVLLEQDLGYKSVHLTLADVGLLFEGVATGNLDAFEDVWLPNHAQYLARVKDKVQLLSPWYIGTTKFSLAAPSYMHITSIGQINSSGAKAIYGVEPGAVITGKIVNNVIPEYHLKVQFIPSSTPAMLSEVAKLYPKKEPFIFIAWSPHWMNSKYKFNYLSDPKGALGNLTHPSRIATLVHKGLDKSDPAAYAFLKSMRLTDKQVNQMEAYINQAGDPAKGVNNWLKKNRHVVQPWVNAAKKAV